MQRIRLFLLHPRLSLILAVTAMVLVSPSLWTGFQQDDFSLAYIFTGHSSSQHLVPPRWDAFSFLTGDSVKSQGLMDLGIVPWWTLRDLRLSFFRPLSSMTHWLDFSWWPKSPFLMHLENLLLLAGVILVVTRLYMSAMGGTLAGGIAALLFALDDAHGLPAGWIASRNALLAGLFGFLALLLHDRWRREGWRPAAFLAPVSLGLGLLSGETALGVGGYLVAYALILDRDDMKGRIVSMIPYALVGVAWGLTYRMLGFGSYGSGFYIDPLTEPISFARAAVIRGVLLLEDQFALPTSSFVLFMSPQAVILLWVISLIVLAIVLAGILPLLRTNETARFWGLGMLLSLPPVCATLPHSRLLLFAGLGGMGILGLWVAGIVEGGVWVSSKPGPRRLRKILVGLFLTCHLLIAPVMLSVSAVQASMVAPFLQDAARTAPLENDIRGKNLVIVNPVSPFLAHFFMTVRDLENLPVPAHLSILAPGDRVVEVYRRDSTTLVITPEGGCLATPFDDVYRAPTRPLLAGDRIEISPVSVSIEECNAENRPSRVSFDFRVPVEDSSLRWLIWTGGRFERFTPPAIGERIKLPAARLF
jgi:hypothetical protein